MGYFGSKLLPIRAQKPKVLTMYRPSVECTGKGNLLCYDAYGGRWFRSSYKAVKEAIDFFIEDYERGNVVNYNDLYALFGISQTAFGYQYGYSPSEDYKVTIKFTLALVERENLKYYSQDFGAVWGVFDEDVLIIEPEPYSMPFESYWEV